jgi:hypothetical protein
MNVSTRNQIIRLWYGGASRRQIARRLRISRRSVVRTLADHGNRLADGDYGERRRAHLPDRPRFETASAVEVYMDDLRTAEGLRRVHVFSYVLTCSRLMHVRFVEAEDLVTALRDGLGAAPAMCRYDNMKVVGRLLHRFQAHRRTLQRKHRHGHVSLAD